MFFAFSPYRQAVLSPLGAAHSQPRVARGLPSQVHSDRFRISEEMGLTSRVSHARVENSTFDVGRLSRLVIRVRKTVLTSRGWPSNRVALQVLLKVSEPIVSRDSTERERFRHIRRRHGLVPFAMGFGLDTQCTLFGFRISTAEASRKAALRINIPRSSMQVNRGGRRVYDSYAERHTTSYPGRRMAD